MGLGLGKRKAHRLPEGKRCNSLPKNVVIRTNIVNPTIFDPSAEAFLRHFSQKTKHPPPLKNLRVYFRKVNLYVVWSIKAAISSQIF